MQLLDELVQLSDMQLTSARAMVFNVSRSINMTADRLENAVVLLPDGLQQRYLGSPTDGNGNGIITRAYGYAYYVRAYA